MVGGLEEGVHQKGQDPDGPWAPPINHSCVPQVGLASLQLTLLQHETGHLLFDAVHCANLSCPLPGKLSDDLHCLVYSHMSLAQA